MRRATRTRTALATLAAVAALAALPASASANQMCKICQPTSPSPSLETASSRLAGLQERGLLLPAVQQARVGSPGATSLLLPAVQ